jgi:hypothetical protein
MRTLQVESADTLAIDAATACVNLIGRPARDLARVLTGFLHGGDDGK